MTDEENEALRNFKSEYENCNHNSSDLIIELNDAKIIFNLIEKQQKRNTRVTGVINISKSSKSNRQNAKGNRKIKGTIRFR